MLCMPGIRGWVSSGYVVPETTYYGQAEVAVGPNQKCLLPANKKKIITPKKKKK